MYKWPNRCSQLRYRASAIPTTGTLAPVQDYSVGDTPDNKVGASDNSWVNRVHQTIGGTPAGTSDNRGKPQTTGGYIRQPVDKQVHQTTEDTPDNRWVHQATGG